MEARRIWRILSFGSFRQVGLVIVYILVRGATMVETVFTGLSSHCMVSKPKMTFYEIAVGLLSSLHLANHMLLLLLLFLFHSL